MTMEKYAVNEAMLIGKLLGRMGGAASKVNPFRNARMMSPAMQEGTNLMRQGIGAGLGAAASPAIGNWTAEKFLGKGEKLNEGGQAVETAINSVVGAMLARRGGIIGNPKMLNSLLGKLVAIQAPVLVHRGQTALTNFSNLMGQSANAATALNTAAPAEAGKPAQSQIQAAIGTLQKILQNANIATGSAAYDVQQLGKGLTSSIVGAKGQAGAEDKAGILDQINDIAKALKTKAEQEAAGTGDLGTTSKALQSLAETANQTGKSLGVVPPSAGEDVKPAPWAGLAQGMSDLRPVGQAVLGAGAGALAGNLAGKIINPKSQRLKALLQLTGGALGAGAGYYADDIKSQLTHQ